MININLFCIALSAGIAGWAFGVKLPWWVILGNTLASALNIVCVRIAMTA